MNTGNLLCEVAIEVYHGVYTAFGTTQLTCIDKILALRIEDCRIL